MIPIRKDNTSGYTGVAFMPKNVPDKRWRARLCVTAHGKTKFVTVGNFPTPEAAFEAYKVAKRKFTGRKSRHTIDFFARRLFSKTLTLTELRERYGLNKCELRNVCVIYYNLIGKEIPGRKPRPNEVQ